MNHKPPVKTRIAEVAVAAGVGDSTVSRVLRNHGSFSEETRDRVMEAVHRLGYVPNRIAGTLASAGSGLVSFVIPSMSNIVYPDILRGVTDALHGTTFQAIVAVSNYDLLREESLVEALLSWRPSAIILSGLEHTERTVRLLKSNPCRIVELRDIDSKPLDISVGFSQTAAGAAAAKHLIARNYRRIGYVGHDLARDKLAAKRFTGFCNTLKQSGISLLDQEISNEEFSIETGRYGLERILDRTPSLDAVYFASDDGAIGGYFHCLSNGIVIPTELAILGHNGLAIGAAIPQPLSTIRTPRESIGQIAARLIVENAPSQALDLGFEVIEGATT